jgi:DNA-directed RNA polymerase specialized sigma24 family protein
VNLLRIAQRAASLSARRYHLRPEELLGIAWEYALLAHAMLEDCSGRTESERVAYVSITAKRACARECKKIRDLCPQGHSRALQMDESLVEASHAQPGAQDALTGIEGVLEYVESRLSLSDEGRRTLVHLLEGRTVAEAAQREEVCTRTVRRRIASICERL